MRKVEDVYREIIKELYIKFFIKNINIAVQLEYMRFITLKFPESSATKKFVNSIKYKRSLWGAGMKLV